jgi:hypothetical protein
VWTGEEMFIFGGTDQQVAFNQTYSYLAPRVLYVYQRP